MCKINSHLIIVAITLLIVGIIHAEDWTVGENWTYKHEGPRPFSDPSVKIKGDRTVEVTKIEGEGAAKRYLMKTVWGTEDITPTTTYIDPNNMIHKMEIHNMAVLLFSPPVPGLWNLKPGEKQTVKTNMDIGGFVVPIEYVAKLLKDETLTVPAGTFEKCQHYEIITSFTNEMGEPAKAKTDHWYHPKVKSFIKEVVITNYQGDNSYTGTSVLKSHTTPK